MQPSVNEGFGRFNEYNAGIDIISFFINYFLGGIYGINWAGFLINSEIAMPVATISKPHTDSIKNNPELFRCVGIRKDYHWFLGCNPHARSHGSSRSHINHLSF